MAVAFAILLGYVLSQHGADLQGPADPANAFDARPLWYFRWLFLLRELSGSAEKLVAMAAPAVVGGILVALPLVDRDPSNSLRRRVPFVAAAFGLVAVVAALTVVSLIGDARDDKHADAIAKSDKQAQRARQLAIANGVPVTGALDVYATPPMYRARVLFEQRCKSCHDRDSADRKGPVIAPGHGNRAWFRGFVTDPSGDAYWGHTKLAKSGDGMKPQTDLNPQQLAEVVEFLYGESGATDVDAKLRDTGQATFDGACNDCHSREEGNSGNSPNLAGVGSRAYFFDFIGNPKSALHMGKDHGEMPRFDKELSLADRDALAAYLVWLRSATPVDLGALGSL
jgi:ubiquinol-cytochrome c reductase cytochrome b subunit